MICVKPRDNSSEAFDRAMKIFKKLCQNDGFIQEIKERCYFRKPSKLRHDKDVAIKREQARKRKRGKK